jgi:hypothetical protein
VLVTPRRPAWVSRLLIMMTDLAFDSAHASSSVSDVEHAST